MNYDEFSFFNQQLASMLRDGIPLEGALKQLSSSMSKGKIRAEILLLESDLAQGVPLPEALARRELPEFYRRMVEVGARGNDLPGVLTLLADHYHRANMLWTRLKGLLVYPALVLLVSLGLTLIVTLVLSRSAATLFGQLNLPSMTLVMMWIPPVTLAILGCLAVVAISMPSVRERLRWRIPGFREASLAQLSSAIALILRNGAPLADALALAQQLEGTSPAAKALAAWRANVEAGLGKPSLWNSAPAPFPPLFLWLIQQGGNDAAAGFTKAAEIYRDRAQYRIELAMYGALPVSILFLGQMIFWQITPLIQGMSSMMKGLSDMGG